MGGKIDLSRVVAAENRRESVREKSAPISQLLCFSSVASTPTTPPSLPAGGAAPPGSECSSDRFPIGSVYANKRFP